ncbi:5-formyltetrahydrofolate cyclo-ligase [Lactococcus taiwanensis]|jgi:5-formyltetrahydrofolate cyclo-ligase|uniref:5-formyltetrahydrofolate cyclo-ligase n=1 Tax=Lactococcus taiwanensis TaxID=1151742 RepID=A0AA45KHA8_9LACT|nr:5-formyltetrahydrofolate cyclo-ligase [Lactococcus taiwanensis]QSE77026.1 5-formyltetrahydrofolate cyclo-ligase [Lactococcus taiwanensis]
MESKAQIREKVFKKLKIFPTDQKKRQTKQVIAQLTASPAWKKAEKVALYMPMPEEFDLTLLFEEEQEKTILIPKCLPQRQLMFANYDKNQLQRSTFGLLEPTATEAIEPDLILVPGLAWNTNGYRIGFGGGYYDRYLANFSGQTASVLYDFQRNDFQPEPHDKPVQHMFIGEKNEF